MYTNATPLTEILQRNRHLFLPVVLFDKKVDKLYPMDFTEANKILTDETIQDTEKFTAYVTDKLQKNGCRYGIGGYAEHRTIYSRSAVFSDVEPRRLHLGVDIWGPANTPVFAPLDGRVHSFAFNNCFGDYGATIILEHQLAGIVFYTLYGHLSLVSLANLEGGMPIKAGEQFASFGVAAENGNWPPHLHFQLIAAMEGMVGDYPGVCKLSEKEKYLANCPNAGMMLVF